MHQTAQRNPLVSKTSRSFTDRRQPLKTGANSKVVTANAARMSSAKLDITDSQAKPSNVKQVSSQKAASQISSGTAKPSPYQPSHQVELLHLQAEADALIVKLQAAGQR